MGDSVEEERKSPLDDILMTSDWHYGVSQTPPTQSGHMWTNPTSWPGAPSQQPPFYMVGSGEPAPTMFFHADEPPGVSPGPAKQGIAPGRETIGTMVDIGGGNFVKVVCRGPGNTVHPQYHASPLEPPGFETVRSFRGGVDPNLNPVMHHQHPQQANISPNYGVFREIQSHQIEALLQQQNLQHLQRQQQLHQMQQHAEHLQQNQSPQHQPHLQMGQHIPPELMQNSPQAVHHKKQQHQSQKPLKKEDIPCQNTPNPSSGFSQNQDQLIQNLVGNWTVPNQTGHYNPFGLGMGQGIDPPAQGEKDVDPVKKSDKRRTRIVAEVRPMRPSYSAVLTTPSPAPSPLKPNQSNNITNNNINNNSTNSANKINSDNMARLKNTAVINGRKAKTAASKANGSTNTTGKLKRQHSGGNDEQSIPTFKAQLGVIGRKPTGVASSSSVGLEEVISPGSPSTSLSRRWVSLDDLENDSDASESSKIFEEIDSSQDDKDFAPNSKKVTLSASVRGVMRGNTKNSPQPGESFLNNQKTQSSSAGAKGMPGLGANANKRPIYINNNLGTTHSPNWNTQQPSASSGTSVPSSNGTAANNGGPSKIDKSSKSAKGCRNCSDERKGAKNEAKSNSNNSARSGRTSTGTSTEKASGAQGKRSSRSTRRKDGLTAASLIMQRYGKLGLLALTWFLHLLSDVVGMSLRLSIHLCMTVWENWVLSSVSWLKRSLWQIPRVIPARLRKTRVWRWFYRKLGWTDPGEHFPNNPRKSENSIPGGLTHNISMPATGEEAMKRLLACKGKDPYSILGVTPNCTDDDVKKYYKRQAFLVHPDKNSQPGAEEAFKILVHAFDLIGEPEKRAEYDRCVAETQQVEQAWSELSDLLSQLHQKMKYAANTIRCTNCGKRHKRVAVARKPFAARFCSQCKIKHSAKEGDIWAETMVMGFFWHYYACMEGAVYDITDWASCQTNNLRHLKPNSHTVQYRIVLGRHRQQSSRASSEPDVENFLSSLYNQAGGMNKGESDGGTNTPNPPRQEAARSRKKGKRNK